MTDKNRIAGEAALACTFIVMHHIRDAFSDEDLESVFEEVFQSVKGAIEAAFATQDEGGSR